jgi:RHS repeat-associated protein
VAHGSNLIYNILGAGGDNIGQVKVVSASPTRYYYLKDHLGSIKVTVDASGNAVGWDDYYPYGAQMDLRNRTASEDGRYKFTGKERDASTGLDYFGARYYDSWTGRWLQVDPKVDDYNDISPYVYCLNNPGKNIDPDGKGPWLAAAAASYIAVGILATATVLAMHEYNYYTNSSYRRVVDQGHTSAAKLVNSVFTAFKNTAQNLLNSGKSDSEDKSSGSKDKGTINEQAQEIKKKTGKNSITLPDGTRVDVAGATHTNEDGTEVETPHTHDGYEYVVRKDTKKGRKAGDVVKAAQKDAHPTTQEDLDKTNEHIDNQNK